MKFEIRSGALGKLIVGLFRVARISMSDCIIYFVSLTRLRQTEYKIGPRGSRHFYCSAICGFRRSAYCDAQSGICRRPDIKVRNIELNHYLLHIHHHSQPNGYPGRICEVANPQSLPKLDAHGPLLLLPSI